MKSEFALIDVDSKGEVSVANLKRVLNFDLKRNISDDLIEDMI